MGVLGSGVAVVGCLGSGGRAGRVVRVRGEIGVFLGGWWCGWG